MQDETKVLMFEPRVAREIGINPAIIVNRIDWVHRWSIENGYGKWIDGVHYVYNTYEQWRVDHFGSIWSVTTLKNLFSKLVDLGIVFRRKYWKGWNQTRGWALNYSHPIVKKVDDAIVKKVDDDTVNKVDDVINTYNTREKQQIPTPVGNSFTPSVRDPYHNRTRSNGELKEHKVSPRSKPSRWDPKDWPEVEEWLASKSQDFRKQVWEHAEYNLLRPKKTKVEYPEAYKKGIVWKSWRDDTKGTSESDFKFVDKTGLKPAPVVRSIPVPYYKKVKADMSFDDEMEMLYEQGGIYDV